MRIIKDGGWRDDGAVRELTTKLGAGRSRRWLHRLLLLSGYKHTRQTHRRGGHKVNVVVFKCLVYVEKVHQLVCKANSWFFFMPGWAGTLLRKKKRRVN